MARKPKVAKKICKKWEILLPHSCKSVWLCKMRIVQATNMCDKSLVSVTLKAQNIESSRTTEQHNRGTGAIMTKPKYRVVPGYLLDKVLQRSGDYLRQLGNAELIEALESTKIEQIRADKYTALLFVADAEEIAAVRILGEVIKEIEKRSRLAEFRYKPKGNTPQQKSAEANANNVEQEENAQNKVNNMRREEQKRREVQEVKKRKSTAEAAKETKKVLLMEKGSLDIEKKIESQWRKVRED